MAGESVSQGWRIVARGFGGAYDYAGSTMVVSTLWFFLGLFPALLAFLVLVQVPAINSILIFGAICVVLLGPLTAAVYSVCDEILRGEEVKYREYFSHLARHYKKAALVTAVMGVILGILVIDVLFFLQLGNRIMQFVGVIWMYLILFWLMMLQYVYSLIVRKGPSVWETLKMSALLALDNVVATFVVLFFVLLTAVASYFLRVPMMLFMIGTIGFIHAAAYSELIRKYDRSNRELESPVKES